MNDEHLAELQTLRRWLHAHPEVSGEEQQTAKKILEFLERYPPDEIITALGGTGIAAIFNGDAPGKTVMIRAELDALPIHEVNKNLPYKSVYKGKGHKCGHDGHMVMVAGLAQIYAAKRPARGRVILLFQPAEETGEGARAVCADPKFTAIKPDYAFALHNLPDYPQGTIICKDGSFSAAVKSMIVRFTGKTSHAADPGKAMSPAEILPDILSHMLAYNDTSRTSEDFARIAIVHLRLGEEAAYGTSAGEGELHLTLRARTPDALQTLWDNVSTHIKSCAEKYNANLRVSFDEAEPFEANMNDPHAVALIKNATQKLGFPYETLDIPNDWGEDFGAFTTLPGVKAAMFGLGSDTLNLHNPGYDFPDEIIPTGVAMFEKIIALLDHDNSISAAILRS